MPIDISIGLERTMEEIRILESTLKSQDESIEDLHTMIPDLQVTLNDQTIDLSKMLESLRETVNDLPRDLETWLANVFFTICKNSLIVV